MTKRIVSRKGEPVFQPGSEEYVAGLVGSGVIGMMLFVIFSFGLNSLLADRGPGVSYSGAPFAVCTPDIVLYSLFLVGMIFTLSGLGYALYYGFRLGLSGSVKVALGVLTFGSAMLFFASMLIYGIEGRLFLLPFC